jgi:acyl-[acyl-carrier-protein]-phospholipid O-acyltransferase/long-chain-fatty-acid--[acyl-carrier-protein] ligase
MPLWLDVPVGIVARMLYRVRALGVSNLPASGAVIISNHLSYVDVVALQLACPRPLRFLAYQGPGTGRFLGWIFRRAGVIAVPPGSSTRWLKDTVKALSEGQLLCVFPEGGISRTGQLMAIQRGYEVIARRAGVPVVPAAVDGLWGSVFSFSGNRYLWKSPRLMPTPVCVAFGPPIPPGRADVATARNAILEQATLAFAERPVLRRHLGREVVRALARRPGSIAIVDRTSGRRLVSAAQLVAAAAVLSRRIRRTVTERRVGIVLPPGAGATIANLAAVCAGKVPVNLNFTVGRTFAQSSIDQSGVRTVISADALRSRLPDFPWPAATVDLTAELRAAGGRRAMLPWMAAAWLLPNQWVAGLMGLPKTGDREEAGLLFTSGSSGNPKGVVLSHRNLLANCAQISSLSILPDTATMLGCLPIFHSFGFTVTLWYPLIRGCRLVTTPSPTDPRALVDSIREEAVSVLIGTPTFIRPLLKKAAPADLRSLDLVVTGAEKLPEELRRRFLEVFNLEILQGYGLTETSPVSNVNQPHPPVTTGTADEQMGKKAGTVGRLLPGMSARVVNPETGEDVSPGGTGILLLRGANVLSQYLGESPQAHLRDGWFVTWDLASIDGDGFVTVEGRLARFSKMGGEMVPHGAIEQTIAEAFGIDQAEAPAAVVVGLPDAAKGEALAVVTTLALSAEAVRERLSAAGLPNLWIPRVVHRVGAIPVLGSGKIDIAGCRRLAAEARDG